MLTSRSCQGQNCFPDREKVKDQSLKKRFVRIGILSPIRSAPLSLFVAGCGPALPNKWKEAEAGRD